MEPDKPIQDNRWLKGCHAPGEEYDATYKKRELAGENVHGEADFVEAYHPSLVLDAGCGTGRVGIELARRGIEVVGADIDPNMLGTARRNAPHIEWHLADIASVQLDRRFDAVVMAGNVMIFLAPGSEQHVLANMARHLAPGGVLIVGFQLSMGYLELDDYDRLGVAAGLDIIERYSTWDRAPWSARSTYVVSVHRLRE